MMGRRVISALVSVALVAGAAGAYLTMSDDGGDTYRITADIEQAPNLFAGGRVTVRGVEVGTITEVEPRVDVVRLTLELDSSVKVPADARLAVVPITLISDRYVQLLPPYEAGAALEGGAHIPLERTAIPAELEDVLTELRGLLSALEAKPGKQGSLGRLIRNLDDAFADRAEELGGTVSGSADVLGNLAASEAQLTGLIANLDQVFVALADRASEIGLVNERFDLVTESLLADQADLEGTIENVAFLSEQGAALIAESGDELGRSFGRLATVLRAILEHEDSLRQGIKWTNVVAEALGATDASGRGLYAYTGLRAPPGTEAAAYNYRIDSRDTVACERIGALVDSFKVLNPNATPAQLRDTLLGFIPPVYVDDLSFILDLLLPVCADLGAASSLDERAQAVIEELAARIGEDRMARLLATWLAEEALAEAAP